MGANDLHDLVAALKQIINDSRGKVPTRAEFESKVKGGERRLDRIGGFQKLKEAAGIKEESGRISPSALTQKEESKLIKQYKALCSRREQIQGFFRSVLDLDEMFERAGNPDVLKLSAQPDTHGKFADRPAFNSYKKFLTYFKPHVHLIMGDFVDCEGLSHWPSDDLEPRRIVPEMKIARGLLQEILDATPTCTTRLYAEGNHERWIEMALAKMPELFEDLADLDIVISLKTLLALEKFGYQLFPLNELIQIGKAHFTHGLYTAASHAKTHLDKLKTNIYYGHLHDIQEHNQTSVEGHMEAASLGCLCRLDAKFLKGKPNNWVHAHGVFEFMRDGTYTFYKPKIINGRMAFNGIIFDGNQ